MVKVMGIDEMNKVFKGYNNDEDVVRCGFVSSFCCCRLFFVVNVVVIFVTHFKGGGKDI